MDNELLRIARRVYDECEVYTAGDSLVITKRANRSYISGVFDSGSRPTRFYGKLEVSYLLGISDGFSVIATTAPGVSSFSLVFKNPRHTGVSAEDFVYPEVDEEKDAEWRAKQPDLSEFMNGTAPVLVNRNFQETMRMKRVSGLVREIFCGDERCEIDDFGFLQEDQDDDATARFTLSLRGTSEFSFLGKRLQDLRELVDTADSVQILVEQTSISSLLSLTFGVYDVRF